MPHPVTGLPTVGMIGGGQLARMTHEAASRLGLSLAVLAEHADDGAALVASDVSVGRPDDARAVEEFAARCDVLTFDHEHVPGELARHVAASGTPVRPGPDALAHAQDKALMRAAMGRLGLSVPAWASVTHPADIEKMAAEHGWPVVLKTVRGGYDGRGVWMINGPDEIPESVANLLVEAQVPIVRELAAVVARRPSGEVAVWPVVETVQRDGMCVEVVAPAPDLPAQTATTAQDIARTIAVQLDVTGVLAVELFQTSAGLLVNELAMRPHNSAHWTIEGATTSQFEQHLRAVLDWPLGGTDPTHPWTVMVNVVGSSVDPATVLPAALGDDPGLHVHLYGKRARPGRKLGHVTVTGDDLSAVLQRARRGAGLLAGNESG